MKKIILCVRISFFLCEIRQVNTSGSRLLESTLIFAYTHILNLHSHRNESCPVPNNVMCVVILFSGCRIFATHAPLYHLH